MLIRTCLDPGNYVVNVPLAPNGGHVVIADCAVDLTDSQYACITIDATGACTSTTDCEVDFDWDLAEDDGLYDDDDAAFGITASSLMSALLIAVVAMIGFDY